MKRFDYNISVAANTQKEADTIMQAVVKAIPRLTPQEWQKIAEVVCNPVQLAMIKSKLGL